MKKILLCLAMAFLFQVNAFPQSCLPDGIHFWKQTQIDSFQINYPQCIEIEGNVMIEGNDISNLNGLGVLTSVGGSLTIGFSGHNVLLESLSGLEGLVMINGNLEIAENPALLSLSGLDNLNTINGDLIVYGNDSLTSLSGLENLAFIGGDLSLGIILSIWGDFPYGNPSLVNLEGLSGLCTVGENFYLYGNSVLTSIAGMSNLDSLGGGVSIAWNDTLDNLNGLEFLTTINGGLLIGGRIGWPGGPFGNQSLTTLTGLENITSIEGSLSISANKALNDLTGLENLTAIGGGIDISIDSSLTSLSGLDNIDGGTITDLLIWGNESLSLCAIQSICDYLASPNGTITIEGNASGCNNQLEVEEACESLSIEEAPEIEHLSIIPNPVFENATLSFYSQKKCPVIVSIYSLAGICLKTMFLNDTQPFQKEFDLNCSDLPSGIYLCRLQAGTETVVKRLIKL